MPDDTKQKALIFLGLVTVVIALIAGGLPRLDFQPGLPLPSLNSGQWVIVTESGSPSARIQISDFFKSLGPFILAIMLVYVLYRLIKGANWKEILSTSVYFFVGILMVTLLLVLVITLLPGSQGAFPAEPVAPPVVIHTGPLGAVPPALTWLVGAVLAMIAALLGAWLFARQKQEVPIPVIEQIGLEADKARQALLSGLDLKNVVIQCYELMSLALKRDQGIERQTSMTPREFERLLEAAGLPYDPVHQLTRLFEAVRYGHRQTDKTDEQVALQYLEAIVRFGLQSRQAG